MDSYVDTLFRIGRVEGAKISRGRFVVSSHWFFHLIYDPSFAIIRYPWFYSFGNVDHDSHGATSRELVVVCVAWASYADLRSCSGVHPARGRCCDTTSKRRRIIVNEWSLYICVDQSGTKTIGDCNGGGDNAPTLPRARNTSRSSFGVGFE